MMLCAPTRVLQTSCAASGCRRNTYETTEILQTEAVMTIFSGNIVYEQAAHVSARQH